MSVIKAFEKRFGGKDIGFENFSEYIGFEWVIDKNEVRGYELVPLEVE